jgi:hypothetical protein
MQEAAHRYVPSVNAKTIRRCLACGDPLPPRKQRYCTMACQHYLLASLNRRTGLLQTLSTRYATFYFTDFAVIMDMMIHGADQIYSYMLPRSHGKKPVEDFCALSNILGETWWREKERTKKRYLASQHLLERARIAQASKDTVIPTTLTVPSVRKNSLVTLEMGVADLTPANLEQRIKQAYWRQAKKHHPDLGGSAQTFIKISQAYEVLLGWARRPTFIRQAGFPDKWLYQGETGRWIKPIILRKR